MRAQAELSSGGVPHPLQVVGGSNVWEGTAIGTQAAPLAPHMCPRTLTWDPGDLARQVGRGASPILWSHQMTLDNV